MVNRTHPIKGEEKMLASGMKIVSSFRRFIRGTATTTAIGLLLASMGCASRPPIVETGAQLEHLGRIQEAIDAGLEDPTVTQLKPGGQSYWEEKRDGGDAPLEPGCACVYQNPGCAGPIVGRAVDECYPRDGVNPILQEKTVPTSCGDYGNKEYNCEDLLGKGAECRLISLECCGVSTTSGYCFLDIEG